MKKIIAMVLCLCLVLSCFAGCQKPVEGEVIKIEIPSYRAGTDPASAFFLDQVKRFNEKYKGVYEVNATYSGGAEDHNGKIKQLGLQNKLPVVFQFSDFTHAEKNFFKKGALTDLLPILNADPTFKSVFVPDGITGNTWSDGALYALPLAIIRPTGMYYNTQGFKPSKPIKDLSWDELIAEMKAQNALYGFQTLEQSWILNLTTVAMIGTMPGGAEMLNAGLDTKITDFTAKYFKDAFAKIKELYDAAGWVDGLGKTYPDVENAFLNNIVSVVPNGQWVITNLSQDKTNWGGNYDGTKVVGDMFPGNVAIANASVYDWYMSGTATEKEIEAGTAFLKFISTQEELEAMAISEGGSIPQTTPSQHFKDEVAKNKVMSDFAGALDSKTVMVPYLHEITPQTAMDAFSANLPAFLRGTMSLDDFCKALTKAAQE